MYVRARLVAIVLAALLRPVPPALAKVPPCPGGRYLVAGAPLLDSPDAPLVDVVDIAGHTFSTASGCGPAKGRMRGTKAGTRLRARFKTCTGLVGKALVKGLITDACGTLSGTFAVPSLKIVKPFLAVLSSCGDGVWDPGAGEQCDGDLGPCSGLCNACSCGGVTTTTAVTATSTSSMPVFPTTTSTSTTIVTGADLVPQLFAVPSTAPARAIVAIDFTVGNIGVATATAPWYEYVLFSTDQTLGGDTGLLLYQRNTNLAPSTQYSANSQQATLPNVAAGNYYIFFQVDGSNAVPEGNELNNVYGPIQIAITNGDLSPTALTPPASATANSVVSISYSIKNLSGTSLAVGPWNDQLTFSSDATFGNADDVIIGTYSESLAGTNGTYNRTRSVTIPASATAGTRYIFLEADAGNQTYETNEGNNVKGPVAITIN